MSTVKVIQLSALDQHNAKRFAEEFLYKLQKDNTQDDPQIVVANVSEVGILLNEQRRHVLVNCTMLIIL